MQWVAWPSGIPKQGIHFPDEVTYNSVIHACAKKGEVQKAEQWFNWITKAKLCPNEVTYSSVIHACAEKGEVDKAEQWFERMTKAKLCPSES